MINDALAAKIDVSKPALGEKETAELNRLVALWVAKCGRPKLIVEDKELNTLVARMLELCKARLRYSLPRGRLSTRTSSCSASRARR